MTIEEYKNKLNEWLESLKKDRRSENTITQYKRSLATFSAYLAANEITEITADTIEDYKSNMEKEQQENSKLPKAKLKKMQSETGERPLLSVSTINIRLKALNLFLKFAGLQDLAVKPVNDTTSNTLNDMLNEKEYYRLLEWADRLNKPKIKLIIETLAGTGIRISELEGITVESLKGRVATVNNKGKIRKVFIPKKLAKKLRQYSKDNGIKTGIIFCSRDGSKMLDQAYIRKELKAIAGKARGISLSKVHPHIFRHLFAKRYAMMPGVNPYFLPMLLGHSDSGQSVTARYIKQTDKELLKLVDELEAFYTNQPEKEKKKNAKK